MHKAAAVGFSGRVSNKIIRPMGLREVSLREILRLGLPQRGLEREVNEWRAKNIFNLMRGVRDFRAAQKGRAPTFLGFLHLRHILLDGTFRDLGLASVRVVTTAWVNSLVDSLQNQTTTPIDIFNFHALGTGTNAEAAGDTALQTELTTQYNPNNTRATGTKTEGASANIYRTVGTNTLDAAAAITEHGVFSDVDTGQGTLMDRSVFSVVNVGNGESLQSTYELTATAGG